MSLHLLRKRSGRTANAAPRVRIVRRWLLGSNYYAICLFGLILAARPLSAIELNHERIHAAQQRELLWLPFFMWYGVEWLWYFIRFRNGEKAYFHIRFEQEAYRHQSDLSYLRNRQRYGYL